MIQFLADGQQAGINVAGVALALILIGVTLFVMISRRRSQPGGHSAHSPPNLDDNRAGALAAQAGGSGGEAESAAYYLDLVRANQTDWPALDQEMDKIRQSFDYAVRARRHRMVVDFMWALDPILVEHERKDEEKTLLRQAISAARLCNDALALASFSHNLAMLLVEEGKDVDALPLFENSLAWERANSDRSGVPNTYLQMAAIYDRQGDGKKAQELRKKAERSRR